MADRDGKGPRERSPRPSKPRGGRGLGGCPVEPKKGKGIDKRNKK